MRGYTTVRTTGRHISVKTGRSGSLKPCFRLAVKTYPVSRKMVLKIYYSLPVFRPKRLTFNHTLQDGTYLIIAYILETKRGTRSPPPSPGGGYSIGQNQFRNINYPPWKMFYSVPVLNKFAISFDQTTSFSYIFNTTGKESQNHRVHLSCKQKAFEEKYCKRYFEQTQ